MGELNNNFVSDYNKLKIKYIKEIKFKGNTIISEKALKKKLELKEVGILKDGAYQPSTLEQDKQRIIEYYRERGYADVQILDVTIDSSFNDEKQRNELTINFIIQEGAQYTFVGLEIKGNEVFSVKELLKQQKLKSGAIYAYPCFWRRFKKFWF